MAKKETLKDWFSKNDGKGWIDCKTGKPCGRKSKTNTKRPYPKDGKLSSYEKKRGMAIEKSMKKQNRVKLSEGGFIAKGCGAVMNDKRKVTTIS